MKKILLIALPLLLIIGCEDKDNESSNSVIVNKIMTIEDVECIQNGDKWGKRAGLVRNDMIVSLAHQVVAFWDGMSRGTKYTIDKARKENVITQVFNVVN